MVCRTQMAPTVPGNWGTTTKKTNSYLVRAIVDEFGETLLRELDKVDMQRWLNTMAETYSPMVFHCHTDRKAICAEAVEQDFLAKDPARKLDRPKTRNQMRRYSNGRSIRELLLQPRRCKTSWRLKLVGAAAVRPGELFAFRWRSFEKLPGGRYALKVNETVYKSKLRHWVKTEDSEDYVALPERLDAALEEWRTLSKWAGESDFIFPNSKGGFMDYENFEERVLGPICAKLGISLTSRCFAAHSQRCNGRADRYRQGCSETPEAQPTGYDPRELREGNSGVGICDGGRDVRKDCRVETPNLAMVTATGAIQ
jgi:hypothetical protein